MEGSAVPPDGLASEASATERAVLGFTSFEDLRTFYGRYAKDRLGSAIARVRFRAGRIDAVWGVELVDGRQVVVKAHRLPVDLEAIEATREAQRVLGAAGFPCPEPLSGPDEVGGRVLSAETLMSGGRTPDGRKAAHRGILAAGLARHFELLRHHRGLLGGVGLGPSWCRYQDGPWPVPHDPIVDFRETPPGYEWLDAFAARAAEQILVHRDEQAKVVGHADWYGGNTLVSEDTLVGTFDWELVIDDEAVLAGFAAAAYAASSTGGGGLSTPEEAEAFLRDYDIARGAPMTSREQRAAAGGVAWILAFNARWQVGLRPLGIADDEVVGLVRERQEDYLALAR